MKILTAERPLPSTLTGAALALGNFDGVHRGHQALLTVAMEEAKRLGTVAGAMIFEPHPRQFFVPDQPVFRLTTPTQKLRLLEAFGLDLAVVQTFDETLAATSAEAFVERYLVEGLKVRHVVIGYDFFFGKDRTGSPELMSELGRNLGFSVSVVAPVSEAGEAFSSSAIRTRLAQGDVRGAADALGHWWRIAGTVIHGAKRGTGLGFPTANITLPKGVAFGHGIYAVRVYIAGTPYHGAAYLGTRPTFDNGSPVLEVFLFNFDDDLYGQDIELEFIEFIRPDSVFTTAENLIQQIAKDCAQAQETLRASDADDPMCAYPIGKALRAG